jgi:hypothetical protein
MRLPSFAGVLAALVGDWLGPAALLPVATSVEGLEQVLPHVFLCAHFPLGEDRGGKERAGGRGVGRG